MSSAPAGERPTLAEALTALALACGVPPASVWLDAAVAAGLAEDAASATSSTCPPRPWPG